MLKYLSVVTVDHPAAPYLRLPKDWGYIFYICLFVCLSVFPARLGLLEKL